MPDRRSDGGDLRFPGYSLLCVEADGENPHSGAGRSVHDRGRRQSGAEAAGGRYYGGPASGRTDGAGRGRVSDRDDPGAERDGTDA